MIPALRGLPLFPFFSKKIVALEDKIKSAKDDLIQTELKEKEKEILERIRKRGLF